MRPGRLRDVLATASVRTGYRRRRVRATTDRFTTLYYDTPAYWRETRWLGTRVVKSPLDLWIYQEIICETRPDLILETGTYRGGSALFLASMCELVGRGRVVSIDLNPVAEDYPTHPRLAYVGGFSSTDPSLPLHEGDGRTMVILDSDHSYDHVLAELQRFGPLVTPGCYLIVEDTAVGGHPVAAEFGRGPMEAVETFLETYPEFEVDRSREKFLMTFNPRGYLRRVAGPRQGGG